MRDISELDGLAHEIKVCADKSDNYAETARQKIATVSTALDAGEFGNWNTQAWLFVKVGLSNAQLPLYLPRPREVAAAMVREHPEKSDRTLAEMSGVSDTTILRARRDARASNEAPDTPRAGRDGKQYPASTPRQPKDPLQPDPLSAIKDLWRKLNADQKEAFQTWISTEGGY